MWLCAWLKSILCCHILAIVGHCCYDLLHCIPACQNTQDRHSIQSQKIRIYGKFLVKTKLNLTKKLKKSIDANDIV